jgi:hypothetical protein
VGFQEVFPHGLVAAMDELEQAGLVFSFSFGAAMIC